MLMKGYTVTVRMWHTAQQEGMHDNRDIGRSAHVPDGDTNRSSRYNMSTFENVLAWVMPVAKATTPSLAYSATKQNTDSSVSSRNRPQVCWVISSGNSVS